MLEGGVVRVVCGLKGVQDSEDSVLVEWWRKKLEVVYGSEGVWVVRVCGL